MDQFIRNLNSVDYWPSTTDKHRRQKKMLLSVCRTALEWINLYSDAFLQAQIPDYEPVIKQLQDAIKAAEE